MRPVDDRPVIPAAGVPAGPGIPAGGEYAGLVDEPVEAPPVEPSKVRDVLDFCGRNVFRPLMRGHRAVPEHWAFTDEELDKLEEPVTQLINRSQALRRIAAASPELAVGMVLYGYGRRNIDLTREIRYHEQVNAAREAEMAAEKGDET